MSNDDVGTLLVVPEAFADMRRVVHAVFEQVEGTVMELTDRVGLPTGALALAATERAIFAAVTKIADQIVGALVFLAQVTQGVRDGAVRLLAEAALARGVPLRDHGSRCVTVGFLGGSRIALPTTYHAPDYSRRPGRQRTVRGGSGAGCYPLLDHLGVIEGASPALASEVARQATALSSFREAQSSLEARGIDLDTKTVRRLTEICGDRALRARDERLALFGEGTPQPTGGEFAGERVLVAFDGGRTRTRVSGKRGRRRKKSGRRGFKTPWREPKLMTICALDADGRKRRDKRPVYVATFEPWKDAFRIFAAEAARRGLGHAREVVIGGDGSQHIWDGIDTFVSQAGINPSRVTKFVDFYHASEHVSELADLCVKWKTKKRQRWITHVLRELRAGRIENIIAAGEKLAIGRRAPKVGKALDYFRARKEFMRYGRLRAQRLPIGTGVVESAIRRIINLRLKGPGIFWEVDNAERVLVLRAHLKAGRWDEVERDIFSHAAARLRGMRPRERTRAAA